MKVFSTERDSYYYSRMDPIGPLPSRTYQQWRICIWHDSAGCLLVCERGGGEDVRFRLELIINTNRPNTAISFNTLECSKSIINGTYRLNRNSLCITIIQWKNTDFYKIRFDCSVLFCSTKLGLP